MWLTALAVLSGTLQALGYWLYIRYALKNGNVPNPLSWLMFGYGTTLLFFLEMDRGAAWQLLVLPAVCAVSSLLVVRLCWRRGGFKNPIDLTDWAAFGLDILLTVCYMAAWVLMSRGTITGERRETAIKLTELYKVENLVLIAPAVYATKVYTIPFGPAFTEAIRSPFSWRETDAWEILKSYKGNLLIGEDGKD